jgi:hypothetical protein
LALSLALAAATAGSTEWCMRMVRNTIKQPHTTMQPMTIPERVIFVLILR